MKLCCTLTIPQKCTHYSSCVLTETLYSCSKTSQHLNLLTTKPCHLLHLLQLHVYFLWSVYNLHLDGLALLQHVPNHGMANTMYNPLKHCIQFAFSKFPLTVMIRANLFYHVDWGINRGCDSRENLLDLHWANVMESLTKGQKGSRFSVLRAANVHSGLYWIVSCILGRWGRWAHNLQSLK